MFASSDLGQGVDRLSVTNVGRLPTSMGMTLDSMTAPLRKADDVAAELSRFGSPTPEWRGWRWVVSLGEEIAFVAEDDATWERLEREAAVLDRLRVPAPRVVRRDRAARLQIRRKVPGLSGFEVEEVVFGRPGKLSGPERYADGLAITPQGERLAADIGRAIFGVQCSLTTEEAAELRSLQAAMLRYRRRVAPLPLDEARRLHQELLTKAAGGPTT